MTSKAQDYFRGLLVTQKELWVGRIVGDATRWIFDVLKNMLTAGVLLAMADKTGSPTLGALANAATGLLGLFVLAPTERWYLDPLHPVKNEAVPPCWDTCSEGAHRSGGYRAHILRNQTRN